MYSVSGCCCPFALVIAVFITLRSLPLSSRASSMCCMSFSHVASASSASSASSISGAALASVASFAVKNSAMYSCGGVAVYNRYVVISLFGSCVGRCASVIFHCVVFMFFISSGVGVRGV